MEKTKVVITVVGKDRVGIIAGITGVLAANRVNILDISQTIMQDFFTMILIADDSNCAVSHEKLVENLEKIGSELGVKITVQREDVFKYMHRI
ncbi:MAG: ACT domain-containing protein [Bacillota bacterium]